jgi:hypothetical protein
MEFTQDGAFVIIERDTFIARLAAHPRDLDRLDNQDIYVTLPSGLTYYATVLTLPAIDALLQRWSQTGESGGGRYFYATDLVITPRPGIVAMLDALEALIHNGEIATACQAVAHPEAGRATGAHAGDRPAAEWSLRGRSMAAGRTVEG